MAKFKSTPHSAITPSGLSMQPPTHVSAHAGTAGGNLRAGSTTGSDAGVTGGNIVGGTTDTGDFDIAGPGGKRARKPSTEKE